MRAPRPPKAGPPLAEKRTLGILKTMPCVYILQSQLNTRFYVGSSREDTAITRLARHNSGQVRSTKSFRPWELAHQEKFINYTDARKRENFLKMGVGRLWIKENFKN